MTTRDLQIRNDNRLSSSPEDMFDLMPEFNDVVETFFGNRFNSLIGDWPALAQRNSSSIQENDKSYILCAEIPGVPKNDIEINISGNLLTLKAEHKEEKTLEGETQGFRRRYKSYQQSFALPTTVDPEKIEAHYENGVLEVVLPKTEQAQAKKIEVQSGKGPLFGRLMGKKEDSKSNQKQQRVENKH